ncbi:methyl-accepting chemotaxis protein [Pigmentibacter sp. JX0631]|uniref:methyl-accepting chemotaxis protein n=1 Tax=Pigmentibacter sp. JX0631 TaxID=2976982 RepID=UPI00246899A7|nr:methyl-accepting chemotaxis protein [Pigmentibacter sp. JX0631]WGL59353.1 methyl-accepting chemotaxis protein [Pigmentibacter sp. JX0631]
MKTSDEGKNYDYSGLKSKLLYLHFFSIFSLFLGTLAIVYFFGSGKLNLIKYAVFMGLVLVFFQTTISMYLRMIEKKSFMVGLLFQKYIEKSQETIDEFIYPKKNILNSFNKQYDMTNQNAAALAQIIQMISKTIEQINDCKAITQVTENRLQNGTSIMEKLGDSIEIIKSVTADMDKMLEIINQIILKSIVITDIVAKTELLAMNASIEAARAGDHGKGFSVVSEEVESLARTSGKSAKQIKDLLNESSIKVSLMIRAMNERIKEGEIVSKRALDAFKRITEGVNLLKEQINIISEGTEMQRGHVKNMEDTMLKIKNDTANNKNTIENGNEIINKLTEINRLLMECSVNSQKAFSGNTGIMFMESNKGNEVRRTLKSMGF